MSKTKYPSSLNDNQDIPNVPTILLNITAADLSPKIQRELLLGIVTELTLSLSFWESLRTIGNQIQTEQAALRIGLAQTAAKQAALAESQATLAESQAALAESQENLEKGLAQTAAKQAEIRAKQAQIRAKQAEIKAGFKALSDDMDKTEAWLKAERDAEVDRKWQAYLERKKLIASYGPYRQPAKQPKPDDTSQQKRKSASNQAGLGSFLLTVLKTFWQWLCKKINSLSASAKNKSVSVNKSTLFTKTSHDVVSDTRIESVSSLSPSSQPIPAN